jgi:predicted nucleic acid-binding protein
MPLLVDTGILYALADRRDAWHRRVRRYLETNSQTLLAPVTILPEVAYLLRHRIGAEAERAFVSSLARGEVAVEEVSSRDWARVESLLSGYEMLGLVDASVVAIAERLKLSTIATTDRRDFAIVRPAHVERFTLVP